MPDPISVVGIGLSKSLHEAKKFPENIPDPYSVERKGLLSKSLLFASGVLCRL